MTTPMGELSSESKSIEVTFQCSSIQLWMPAILSGRWFNPDQHVEGQWLKPGSHTMLIPLLPVWRLLGRGSTGQRVSSISRQEHETRVPLLSTTLSRRWLLCHLLHAKREDMFKSVWRPSQDSDGTGWLFLTTSIAFQETGQESEDACLQIVCRKIITNGMSATDLTFHRSVHSTHATEAQALLMIQVIYWSVQ